MYGSNYWGQTYYSGYKSSYPVVVRSINGGGWGTFYWAQDYWAQHTYFFGSQVYTLSLTDSISLTSSILRSITLNKIETLIMSEALQKTISTIKTDTLVIVSSLVKNITRFLSDSISTAEVIIRNLSRPLTDTLTMAESISKSIQRILSDTILTTDKDPDQTNNEWAGYYFGGYIWSRGNIQYGRGYITLDKRKLLDFTESISLSEVFAVALSKIKSFTDSISISEIFAKNIIKNLLDTISASDLPYEVTNAAWATGYWGSYVWSRGRGITRRFFSTIKYQYRELTDTITLIEKFNGLINGISIFWIKIGKTAGGIWTLLSKVAGSWSKGSKPSGTWTNQSKPVAGTWTPQPKAPSDTWVKDEKD